MEIRGQPGKKVKGKTQTGTELEIGIGICDWWRENQWEFGE